MKNKFLINKSVVFCPDTCRLIPVAGQGVKNTLNIPSCRCFQLLLQRPGEVICQQDFIKEVWEKQGQSGSTNTLYQNISLLRRALRSAGLHNNIIQTIPKEGMRFSGTVTLSKKHECDMTNPSKETNKNSEVILSKKNEMETKLEAIFLGTNAHLISFCSKWNMIIFIILLTLLLFCHLNQHNNASHYDSEGTLSRGDETKKMSEVSLPDSMELSPDEQAVLSH
uniref:winged helix-turn-helix domain-containing protein n=1 Tax=Yersinia frederiksenii TaxID=29484 RepID=UPI001F4BDC28|nr:winged helix-turn-helix domain-containing protein [Yersinia frederiksenii]ULG19940.1 hypothetical protein 49p1_00240 [Yersinia frederiksenii]